MNRSSVEKSVWPYPAGTTVIYTSVRDNPRTARITRTTTQAWQVGDGTEFVIGIEGVSGGVSISHLAVVSAEQLDEAHARTHAWLNKFQEMAAEKQVELLKWRVWAQDVAMDPTNHDDDDLRFAVETRLRRK